MFWCSKEDVYLLMNFIPSDALRGVYSLITCDIRIDESVMGHAVGRGVTDHLIS